MAVVGTAAYAGVTEAVLRGSQRASAEQAAVRQASDLFAKLLPEAGSLTLVTHDIGSKVGDAREVVCLDGTGRLLGVSFWDPDAGKLSSASLMPGAMPRKHGATLPVADADSAAWFWLCQLGQAVPGTPWRTAGRPHGSGSTWTVKIQSAGRTAYVVLDAHSGRPTYVRLVPVRPRA